MQKVKFHQADGCVEAFFMRGSDVCDDLMRIITTVRQREVKRPVVLERALKQRSVNRLIGILIPARI